MPLSTGGSASIAGGKSRSLSGSIAIASAVHQQVVGTEPFTGSSNAAVSGSFRMQTGQAHAGSTYISMLASDAEEGFVGAISFSSGFSSASTGGSVAITSGSSDIGQSGGVTVTTSSRKQITGDASIATGMSSIGESGSIEVTTGASASASSGDVVVAAGARSQVMVEWPASQPDHPCSRLEEMSSCAVAPASHH